MSAAAIANIDAAAAKAKTDLDAHTRNIIHWHFSPETGSSYWLDWAQKAGWDPRKQILCFDDIARKFPNFDDDALRGGPLEKWIPKGLAGKPVYVFETGGTTGLPKSRVQMNDFRTDYEQFSDRLPEKYFPKNSNWLMLGPSGPRRLRLAVEHLAQYRGGISFCIDLDPRWVVKVIKKGWMEHLKAYQEHCIDQAITILAGGHNIKCAFMTPKLLDALAAKLEAQGKSIADTGITGIFCGGTEMNSQWCRFAIEELLGPNVFLAATYGNTLMGLAASRPLVAADNYKITYYAPQPRAVLQLVDLEEHKKPVGYGETGRVMLTTLTQESFYPNFLERDEAEREKPCEQYPWDGVSGVRPFRKFASTTVVGVY